MNMFYLKCNYIRGDKNLSEFYDPRFGRGGYGKFNIHKNFISLETGTDAFFLEDEANEMQWMQNELRAELVRKEYYSGIYKKEINDIIPSANIFANNTQIFNSFLIKPMIANINGYFIDIIGNNGYNNQGIISGKYDNIDINKLNYIQLPDPPQNGNYYDFVYIEMNFVELKFSDTIWHNGNRNNSFGSIPNDLFDRRVNGETNRRIQLQWNINVSRVPMNNSTFSTMGTLFDESMTAIYTPAKGAYHKNSLYGFWNATTALDNKIDSDDIGLWIAGRGLQVNDEIAPLRTINGYSYAIPLFKIIRRNIDSYSSINLLGSKSVITNENTFSNRPDGKFANIIYEDDIIDLRNIIRINNISKVLHENFENILLNKTNYETKLYSTFFGIDKVEESESTLLYEGCNKDTFNTSLLYGNNYDFVPGVEQEAILFKKDTFLQKSFNVYNVNIKGLTIQFFIKTINDCGLFSIMNNGRTAIIAYIENNTLFIITDHDIIYYDFTKHYNKFTHIAVAMRDTNIALIINNKIITTIVPTAFNFTDIFTVHIGYAQIKQMFCENVLFDEIEIINIYKNQFNRIPKSIGEDNADIAIDPQLARKTYTLIGKSDTYTYHKKFKSNNKGILEFAISLPLTLTFTEDTPIIYFDNESVQVDTEVNVTWIKNRPGETEEHPQKWYCIITGLGALVTYNLVIIAYVNYPSLQGITNLPIKAHAAFAEKESKTFYTVADSCEMQEHNLNYTRKDKAFTTKDKLITYNPYIYKYGFCTILKYTKNINANQFSMLANEYMKTVAIFAIMYNGKNILDSYSKIDDSYVINLSKYISGIIEIYLVTDQNCCVYSPTKSGIINLYKIEEIKDFGNGTRKEFVYRSNTRISSFLQGKFKDTKYHYVFVNGLPTKVSVTIDGSFVHYKFTTPPVNKANIIAYIVSEYDLLRSERLEFVYEINKDIKTIDNISEINNSDIVYNEKEIYVTTDGYGIYPYKQGTIISNSNNSGQVLINNTLSDSDIDNIKYLYESDTANSEYNFYILNKILPTLYYLPTLAPLEFKITPIDILNSNKCDVILYNEIPQFLAREPLPITTNLSAQINYCVPNVSGALITTFNKLKTDKSTQAFKGYDNCSIDNKSFYSLTVLDKDIAHINVYPFLIQDKNHILKLGIFTTFDNKNLIYIDATKCAMDIYNLNIRYLLKHI